MSVRNSVIWLMLIGLVGLGASASGSDRQDNFLSRNQIGVRLGGWINQGDDIPDLINVPNVFYFESKVRDGSFYFEGYYAHRLLNQLLAEFSVGVANRGSVTIDEQGVTDYGNLMVYPILVNARIYPFGSIDSRFQPFVSVGGGVYYGRQSIQITNDYYYDASYRERSATDFDIALAGGFDWLLGSNLGLEFRSGYHPIHFATPLLTAKDYDAVTVTVGIKYFYKPNKAH
ncbi:MAG: hypothetical protein P1R58_03310 [bacterium]|nr:hypothetical protein [bacterium]